MAGRREDTPRPAPLGGETRPSARALAALEQRIQEMERRLRELEGRVAEVARAGNFMETRRVGEEHAALERALRELYHEWAQRSEAE